MPPKPKPQPYVLGPLISQTRTLTHHKGIHETTGECVTVTSIKGKDSHETNLASIETHLAHVKTKTLSHPNILTLQEYTLNTDSEPQTLIIQSSGSISNQSLSSLLNEWGKLEESVVRDFTRQILSGWAYLTEHELEFRGLDAGNVLVDAGDGSVKLFSFDFGLGEDDETARRVGLLVLEMMGVSPGGLGGEEVGIPDPLPPELGPDTRHFLEMCFDTDPGKSSPSQLLKNPFCTPDPGYRYEDTELYGKVLKSLESEREGVDEKNLDLGERGRGVGEAVVLKGVVPAKRGGA